MDAIKAVKSFKVEWENFALRLLSFYALYVYGGNNGAKTLSLTTLSLTTLSITTLSMMTFHISTISITTLSITTLNIMTLRI